MKTLTQLQIYLEICLDLDYKRKVLSGALMFERNEKGNLVFNKLDFEILIADIIEDTEPKNMDDLKWMVSKMIDAVQQIAWEYTQDSEDIEEEWEDIYYPTDMF